MIICINFIRLRKTNSLSNFRLNAGQLCLCLISNAVNLTLVKTMTKELHIANTAGDNDFYIVNVFLLLMIVHHILLVLLKQQECHISIGRSIYSCSSVVHIREVDFASFLFTSLIGRSNLTAIVLLKVREEVTQFPLVNSKFNLSQILQVRRLASVTCSRTELIHDLVHNHCIVLQVGVNTI